MRFSLIDQITSLEKGQSIVARKNLTMAEEYLGDHFPGFPVMPGVLVVETMVQASAWLMRLSTDFSHSTILLKEAKAVRFKSFVSPGQTLEVRCEIKKWEDDICVLKTDGLVDGKSVTNARLTLQQFNQADKNKSLKKNDERLIDHFQQQFPTLWKEAIVS